MAVNGLIDKTECNWQKLSLFQELVTTKEDVAAMEDAEILWNGIIVWKHYAVWIAPPNAGKTLIAMQAACDLAAEGLDVIYFQFDAGADQLKSGVHQAEAHGFHLFSPIRGATADKAKLYLEALTTQEEQPNLVIFLDTLRKFEDLYGHSAANFYNLLRRLTLKEITVIALSHTNKRKEDDDTWTWDGKQDLKADCDEMLIFYHNKDELARRQTVSVEIEKQRATLKPVTFTFSLDDLEVKATEYEDLRASANWEEVKSENFDLVLLVQDAIEVEPVNQSELTRLLRNHISERKASRLLKSGVGFGWIRHKGEKNAWLYSPLN